MNIKNRISKLENQKQFSNTCECTISDLPELLTAAVLPPVCERCGGARSEKQIEMFGQRPMRGNERLKIVSAQYARSKCLKLIFDPQMKRSRKSRSLSRLSKKRAEI